MPLPAGKERNVNSDGWQERWISCKHSSTVSVAGLQLHSHVFVLSINAARQYKCQWKVSFMLAHTKLVGRRLSILSCRLLAPKLMAVFTFSQAIYTNCSELLTSLGTMKDNKDEGCIFSLTELWRPGHKSFKQKGLNRPRGVLAAAEEEHSDSFCQRAGGCCWCKHSYNLHRNRSKILSCWSWCVRQGQVTLLILPVISERFISQCLCWRNGLRIPGLTLSMNVSGAVPGVKFFSCSQSRQAHHL